ncbi:protein ALP1-like, partial [Acipenser oxyrinchus oxyrinchus]
TNYREAIGPAERLAICLRFLATSDSFQTISFSYRVGHTTVGNIVSETCNAMWNVLQDKYMPIPIEDDWKEIADKFNQMWNFPNCIGAIDVKHINIQAQPNLGSMFFNYKGTFSIILLAPVEAEYKFCIINVGSYGRNSDGGVFSRSVLVRAIDNKTLHIPPVTWSTPLRHFGPQPHIYTLHVRYHWQK